MGFFCLIYGQRLNRLGQKKNPRTHCSASSDTDKEKPRRPETDSSDGGFHNLKSWFQDWRIGH